MDNGNPLNPETRYKVAVPDVFVRDMQKLDYGETIIGEHGDYADIFIDYLKTGRPIPKDAAGRIKIKKGEAEIGVGPR